MSAGTPPALSLSLPGEWRALPLGDDRSIAAEVRAFVGEHYGRRDDQATLRADQRGRLGDAARRARDAGATQFHLSLTAPGRLAFAATVAEYRPDLPLGSSAEPAAVADVLVRVLAGGPPAGHSPTPTVAGDASWDAFVAAGGAVFDRGDGLVLRTSRRLAASSPDDAATAVVDYWLTQPGRAAAVLLTFTTALAELESLLTELFDAVVGAAVWTAPAPGALRSELTG